MLDEPAFEVAGLLVEGDADEGLGAGVVLERGGVLFLVNLREGVF